MFKRFKKIAVFVGSALLSCTAFSSNASADDNPKLRVISGRTPVTNDATIQTDARSAEPKPAAPEVAKVTAPKAPVAQPSQNAKQDTVAVSLPVSDITLPLPPAMTSAKKKAIEQKIAGILNTKAMRNTIVGIEVRDLDEGSIVYAKNSDRLLKPASNNKLLTTAAALHILGADYQFETKLYANGKIKDGVLNGDLHLHIDHDFTWSTRFYPTNGTPLRGLLQQIQAKGIHKITGKIIVSGYVVYGGTTTAVLHAPSHLRIAANQFGALLKKEKISYNGMQVNQNYNKFDGNVIASWKSPMLSEAIVPLNRASHNEYADMLMLAMGAHDTGKNTYEAGAAAVQKWLKSAGLAEKGVVQHDGSGLSHDNRVTAHFFNNLTAYMLKTEFGREWAASMSISGFDGTYGGRLASNDALGRVYAKSGTLRDVISGTGFFVNSVNGHTYAFSLIVNNMRQKKNTRAALDQIVRAFLGDNDNTMRPAIPMMQSLRKEADGRVIARWDQIADVKGYRVYTSVDGATWTKRAETKDTVLIMPDEPMHMRITSVAANGAESNASLVFSYRPGSETWSVVDVSRCRADAAMRPTNHLFTHERPLATFIDNAFGIETVRDPALIHAQSKGVLWHDVACSNKLVSTDEAIAKVAEQKIPLMLNIVDPTNVQGRSASCDPANGHYLGCYAEGVVTMDRRVGKRAENTRLRKAAGSLSMRPTAIKSWNNAENCLTMADQTVASCDKKAKISIIGVDLEALDSFKTQTAVWNYIK